MTVRHDVHQMREVEEALRRSEAKYRRIFEKIQDIFFQTDDQGIIVEVSPSVERYGYTREELIGSPAAELYEEPKQRIRLTQLLENGDITDSEVRLKARDGRVVDFSVSSHVLWSADGAPAGMEGCLRDISDRKLVEEELRIHRDRLEELVGERTAELTQTNERLLREMEERWQAEEALRESEKRLASIYDTVGDVIFLLDVEKDGGYRFTSVNHAFLSVTGLPAEAVVGKRVNDVIPEPSLTLVLGKYRQAVQKKAIVRWEETSDYPAGRLTGEVSVVAVFDEGGNCTHLVGTVHDITERKQAEEALRESEKRFRQVLDVSSDMIYKLDLESDTFDYISPSVLPLTGFAPEEFIAMGPRGLRRRIHPEDLPDFRRGSEEFVELGSHPGFEYRLQCKDGEYRWLSDDRALVRGEDGRPLALVGTVRNVTERRQAEEALRESEERFRSLSAAAPIGIMLIDNKDGTVYCNKRFLSIFGLPKEQAMGFGWVRSLHPDDREAFLDERSKAMAEGREFIREFRVVTPQGETRWLSVHTTPLLSQEGVSNTRVGTLADITERRQAEEALRKSEELFRTLSASAPVGIFLMDDKGQVIYANERL
jgi:PAS domain S-box-containing protein